MTILAIALIVSGALCVSYRLGHAKGVQRGWLTTLRALTPHLKEQEEGKLIKVNFAGRRR